MEEFEASASAKKTKTIYISTVFGIAMVLSMIGLLGLILVEANNLSRYVKENIVLNIFVDDAALRCFIELRGQNVELPLGLSTIAGSDRSRQLLLLIL